MSGGREMARVIIRNATEDDLDGVMAVEDEWPEDQRAPREKFVSRLKIFPRGFFLAVADGRIVGVSTSTVTRYDPDDLGPFRTWERCTNDGFLYPLGDMADYNALYIVSNGIRKSHRGTGVREALIRAHVDLTRRMGLAYTVTGAMLPGFDAHCRERGDTPVEAYAFLTRDGVPVDPTLRKLASLGLVLPDARHLIPGYYHSPESRDYGALLVLRHG
ncbi:MAG: hypothetical protein IT577_13500 [Verrucomicrobiae bacterium]|nr:hypothetical protein [Verrucomicrobiae bacterium]